MWERARFREGPGLRDRDGVGRSESCHRRGSIEGRTKAQVSGSRPLPEDYRISIYESRDDLLGLL